MTRLSHFSILILILPCTIVLAQKSVERNQHNVTAEFPNIRSLYADGNRIRTILYNTGSLSGPGVLGNVYDMVWNGLGYAYEIGFLAGARVPSAATAGDSLSIIIDGFGSASRSTADGDFAPDGVTKWGWLPTARYAKDGSTLIANNRDPGTWPSGWGSWSDAPGNAGADLELVYEMNDSTDAEFPYYPVPADSSRRGLGLSTTARYYQFAHPNLEDVLFTFFDVRNVSPKPLTKMVAGVIGDPHIGGNIDYSDDAQDYNVQHRLIYSWDPDKISMNPFIVPGYFGYTLIATPENKGTTSYGAMVWGGVYRPKNDSLMFANLSEGVKNTGMFYSTDPYNIGDYNLIQGTGFFTLASGAQKTFGAAYLFAQDLPGIIERATVVEREVPLRFSAPGTAVKLTAPAPLGTVTAQNLTIQWTDAALDNDTTVSLFYSNTPKEGWNLIAAHVPNNGSYQWNAAGVPDGIFYKVHLFKEKSGTVSYDSTHGYFTMNRPGDAPPEVALLAPRNIMVVNGVVPVRWIAGDADNDAVSITLAFSDNDGATYTPLAAPVNNGLFLFNTRTVANTPVGRIKVVVTANGKSTEAVSGAFRIANPIAAVTDTASLKHLTGRATGKLFPGIADSAALTGHTYRVTFDSVAGTLRYSLFNKTMNAPRLTQEYLTGLNGTGVLADGMRVWFENHALAFDTGRSKFTSPVANVKTVVGKPTFGTPKLIPMEYAVTFGSIALNANGNYVTTADSFGNSASPLTKKVAVPFIITNVTDSTAVQAFVQENSAAGNKTGRWDWGEPVTILTPPPYRTVTTNTSATFLFSKIASDQPVPITGGEVFRLRMFLPFTPGDVYEFVADKKYAVPTGVRDMDLVPETYRLEQNFPNPFNPETNFLFSLTQPARTSLTVYDAIGRVVRVVVDEELPHGIFHYTWDGTDNTGAPVASGMYLYRLRSGSFTESKKMLLMR